MNIDFEQIAKLDHENALCDDLDELIKISSNCAFHKVKDGQIDKAKSILESINSLYVRNGLDPIYDIVGSNDMVTELKRLYINILNQDKYGGFLDENK